MTPMRPKVYVETSVISYLTAWPSRDLVKAAHQQITREWWETRGRFEIDYLLTWNCTHIAHAESLPRVREVIESLGHFPPVICTPEGLLEVRHEL